jgi:hypothetical protein
VTLQRRKGKARNFLRHQADAKCLGGNPAETSVPRALTIRLEAEDRWAGPASAKLDRGRVSALIADNSFAPSQFRHKNS